MKSIVVYYTRTGNTKFAAEAIASELGADIEEVVDLKKREGRLNFLACGRDAMGEKLTEIAPTKLIPAEYDLIVIGTPVWAWRPTPAIRTYVSKNDLAGKKVAVFLALDSPSKDALDRTKAMMPNSTIVSELMIEKVLDNKDENKKKIAEWCNTLRTA